MPKLCRKIVFVSTKKIIFVSNLTIMNKIVRTQKLIKIFFHLCFVISVFFLFRYNSILRPLAEKDYYKEYLSALFMVIMLYINYFLLIPHFFLKRKTVIYLLLSLTSIVMISFLEIILLTSNIKDCLPHELSNDEIRKFILVDFFSVCGRNMLFLLFFFMLKIFENERKIRDNEQLALAKSKGFISVSTKDSTKYISVSEIFYILHEKNYCYIHTFDGNKYSKYVSLTKMSDYLPDIQFIRINRNIIINKGNIISFTRENVTIYNGCSSEEKIFSLSENYIPDVKELMAENVGLKSKSVGLNGDFVGINSENDGLKKIDLEEFKEIIAKDEDLLQLCKQLAVNQSINMKKFSETKGVSLRTIERKMQYLKENNVIQHEGARKNGNYAFTPFLSEEVMAWLKTIENDLPAIDQGQTQE